MIDAGSGEAGSKKFQVSSFKFEVRSLKFEVRSFKCYLIRATKKLADD
jgi:hypothetical protein